MVTVVGQVVESESTTITINGKQFRGSDFKAWRQQRKQAVMRNREDGEL